MYIIVSLCTLSVPCGHTCKHLLHFKIQNLLFFTNITYSLPSQCLAGNIGAGLPTGLGFSLGASATTGQRLLIFQVCVGGCLCVSEGVIYERWLWLGYKLTDCYTL